jgi:hypothetical protein
LPIWGNSINQSITHIEAIPMCGRIKVHLV